MWGHLFGKKKAMDLVPIFVIFLRFVPYLEESTRHRRQFVEQSFAKSLENLQTTYLDSLVLHSPMRTMDDTIRVWNVFQTFYDSGKVKRLGISNIYSLEKLKTLWNAARVSIPNYAITKLKKYFF